MNDQDGSYRVYRHYDMEHFPHDAECSDHILFAVDQARDYAERQVDLEFCNHEEK